MVTYPHTPFHDKLFSLFQKVSRLMTFPLVQLLGTSFVVGCHDSLRELRTEV